MLAQTIDTVGVIVTFALSCSSRGRAVRPRAPVHTHAPPASGRALAAPSVNASGRAELQRSARRLLSTAMNGEHAGHDSASWNTAFQATVHCLTGCAIGEMLGMVIATAVGWGDAASIQLDRACLLLRLPADARPRTCGRASAPPRVRCRAGGRHRLDPDDGDRRQRVHRAGSGRAGRRADRQPVLGASLVAWRSRSSSPSRSTAG